MSSPREREKRDRRESRGDEREGQGRKRKESEERLIIRLPSLMIRVNRLFTAQRSVKC